MVAATIGARIASEPLTETVACGYDAVTVREITVSEVRAWLQETSAQTWRDPVLAMTLEEIGLDELARMCDRTADQLEAYTPSQLSPLISVARRLNPHFFRLRDALLAAASRIETDTTHVQSPQQHPAPGEA